MTQDTYFLEPSIPVTVFEADEPGPTAIVQGGIHGDEVAGVHALQELLEEGLHPRAGRLIVIPVMNPRAYRARQRAAPGGLDLNRCFPGDPESARWEHRVAARLMAIVRAEQPAVVATLHESMRRYHPDIPRSFAQTIIYGAPPVPELVTRVVERMNAELQDPYEQWAPHYYPVPTASTDVIVAELGCMGLCIETWRGFDLRRRVDMQREVVLAILDELGMRPSVG